MRFKIDWASLIVGSEFTVFALFYYAFEGNFPSTSPPGGGAYIWRGLYMEGLIFEFHGTFTCLGYEFCFQQHDNVTRQSNFFNPSSTYLRLNKNPITPDVTVFYIHIYKQLLFFFGNSVYVYFRGDLQYSLSILLTLHKNLNFVSS